MSRFKGGEAAGLDIVRRRRDTPRGQVWDLREKTNYQLRRTFSQTITKIQRVGDEKTGGETRVF
jgi:hypothetical protein